MALKIGHMCRLVRPKPKFLDSWESNHLSKAALKRSLNFLIFIDTTGTLILAHCVKNDHWRRSALNSAGALKDRGGEFRGIFTPFYTIKFRGLCKSGGARAPAAPPSSAPMYMNVLWIYLSYFLFVCLLS